MQITVNVIIMSLCKWAFAASVCATVVDPADIPLPHASIKIASLSEVARHYEGVTNDQGKVCMRAVPEGIYSVEASLGGFLNVRYYPVRINRTDAPNPVDLSFRLPISWVGEGLLVKESIISGSLKAENHGKSGIRICLFREGALLPTACDITDDIGEYAVAVQPGLYWVEMSTLDKNVLLRRKINLSVPGIYRDRLSLGKP